MFRSRTKYPAYRLDCCGDEDVVNSLDGGLKIRILHTNDDVEFTGALIDHLDIDAGMSQCGEDSSDGTTGALHTSANHCDESTDLVDLEADLALIAVVGRGMKGTRGTVGRIFSALAHARINVKMIDQGSSELNIIIGVKNSDFETAIKAIYDIFITAAI